MGHAVSLTGLERRRRWSLEDRAQILAEAFAPGAVVCEVARRFDFATWADLYLATASFGAGSQVGRDERRTAGDGGWRDRADRRSDVLSAGGD